MTPDPPRPRLDARLVLTAVLAAIPVLWLIGQVLFSQAGDECRDDSRAGGLLQLFVPGDFCTPPAPPGR